MMVAFLVSDKYTGIFLGNHSRAKWSANEALQKSRVFVSRDPDTVDFANLEVKTNDNAKWHGVNLALLHQPNG